MKKSLVLLALILAGCGVEDTAAPGASSTSTTEPVLVVTTTIPKTPSTTTSTTQPDPNDDPAEPKDGVEAAVADLARRLDVPVADVELITATEVTWSDGSVGCPQDDMSYTQALVPGSLIVLEVDGVSYEYHSAAGQPPFYCDNPIPPVEDNGYGDV